jgi:glyoxalase family protein
VALEGLHHVTAIPADAPRNVDFYVRLLGLRLIKKTVNFDQRGRLPPLLRRRAGDARRGADVPRVPGCGTRSPRRRDARPARPATTQPCPPAPPPAPQYEPRRAELERRLTPIANPLQTA